MNYLAHAFHYLDQPYLVAGTAIPDWLNVVDRKVRCRAKAARPLVDHPDTNVALISLGIVQHHWDDDWFHANLTFQQLCVSFAVQLRQQLSDDSGMRPSFLGHILVEILLDWSLSLDHPTLLNDYYQALKQIDPGQVQSVVNRISKVPTDRLQILIPRMISERFLEDYADDKKLHRRLNQVMRRVKLPELSEAILEFLPEARSKIRESHHQLLAPDETDSSPVDVWQAAGRPPENET